VQRSTQEACAALQADSDHHVKDTYNYVTVQADIKVPGRHFAYLADQARHAAFEAAICAAIARLDAEDKDVRVLNLGCGAGGMSVPPWVVSALPGNSAVLRCSADATQACMR
jgi:hypothetical protein